MDDVDRKIICLKERLRTREMAMKRKQTLTDRKLRTGALAGADVSGNSGSSARSSCRGAEDF